LTARGKILEAVIREKLTTSKIEGEENPLRGGYQRKGGWEMLFKPAMSGIYSIQSRNFEMSKGRSGDVRGGGMEK